MRPTLAPHSTVRLRPAPACDPPYDDERHPDAWGAPPQPPLELPPPAPSHRDARDIPATPPPAAIAPESRAAAARFVNTCLEIVNGLRPVTHIRMLSRPLEAAGVLAVITDGTRRIQRVARHAGAGREERVKLRRMRTCQPSPGILEIAAVIGTRQRAWAAAFRLEHRQGRWQCTAAAVP